MDIVVIGAGIGGLVAAATLLQRGHRVRVCEQAAVLDEIGAGVQLSANAVKVLDALGLRQAIAAVAVRPKGFEFRRFDTGELLHRIALGEQHEAAHKAPYFQIHRADLQRIVAGAVRALDPAAIALGSAAQRIAEFADHVEVSFAGGSSARAELLIGADGIKSTVRRQVLGADAPRFTGQFAWRCIVPIERIAALLRTDLVSTIWCGPHNHAVMYYLRGGELLNFVGCVEKVPGDTAGDDESWTAQRPWSELDADYRDWHPMVRAVIEASEHDACYRWALHHRVPSVVWSSARVTMLGDAVHATLPYMAQGAAMAIEDAAVLARALELPLPLAERLRRYQQHRAPRTARVVAESSEMGELYHIQDAGQMRQAFAERNIASSRNGWLYPYDPLHASLDPGDRSAGAGD